VAAMNYFDSDMSLIVFGDTLTSNDRGLHLESCSQSTKNLLNMEISKPSTRQELLFDLSVYFNHQFDKIMTYNRLALSVNIT
jgi:hypothetical protein